MIKDSFSSRFKFSNGLDPTIPKVAAGVYAIWQGEQLVYCGMSGKDVDTARKRGRSEYGLITRLRSHYLGRLSGDQFCVYVANRCVIPRLEPEQLPKFESGELTLDVLTRTFIHRHLEYQFAIVETSAEAYAVEEESRAGSIFGVKPELNPLIR